MKKLFQPHILGYPEMTPFWTPPLNLVKYGQMMTDTAALSSRWPSWHALWRVIGHEGMRCHPTYITSQVTPRARASAHLGRARVPAPVGASTAAGTRPLPHLPLGGQVMTAHRCLDVGPGQVTPRARTCAMLPRSKEGLVPAAVGYGHYGWLVMAGGCLDVLAGGTGNGPSY